MEDERRKILISMLRDESEEVRNSAAEALEKLEGIENLDTLIEKYRSGDKVMKMKVIYAMGKLRAEDCFAVLIHALSSPEEDVRAAAVRVLGEASELSTLQPLLNMLNDPSLTIRTLTVEALARFPSNRNLDSHLIPILDSENKHLVIAALNTLGKLNSATALDKIMQLTRHDDATVRKTAAEVLGEIQG